SWEYQDEGTTLIFHLNRNIKWHDDKSFTADDVIFTIHTLLNNRRNAPSQYKKFISNVKRADKIDAYTVKVVFQNAYDNSIENFIFPIISQHHVGSMDNVYKSIDHFFPVGTGPYKVDEIEKLKYIKLKKNEMYWKQDKPVSDLIFKIVPSPEESIGLLEINDIDIAMSQNHDWEKYLEDKTLSIYDFISNEVEILGFNFSNSLLMDRRIRQAIAYVIDQDEIIDNVYFGTGIKSDNIYYPNYLGINKALNTYTYDLEKSKELLKEAGFENKDEDIYLEDEQGNDLTLNLLVNSENKNRVATAKIIKKSLDKVGIMTKIIYIGYDEYQQYIDQGKFDMFLGGWSVSPVMDFRFALHSKYNNPIGYYNEYLDYLLVELQRYLPQDEKEKVFHEITDILEQDLPYYTLLYKEYAIIAKNELVGNVRPNIMNIYNGAENWQIEKIQ
ncbi:MAG: ABC transporter substrate-binding protein, partial [Clostridia bacterium]|nr:ABC transporter substrate-binding protein [Clostridia bacterium]